MRTRSDIPAPRNVLIIGMNFPPDFGGERGWNIARALKLKGHNVTILTNVPNFPSGKAQFGYSGRSIVVELVDSIRIIRVPTFPLPYKGVISRLLIFTSFSMGCLLGTPFVRRRIDVIISRGPQPFAEMPAFVFKKLFGASLLSDITDAWPEALILVPMNPILLRALTLAGRLLNALIYEAADGLITHTSQLRDIISRYTRKPIHVLTAAIDLQEFRPLERNVAIEQAPVLAFARDRFTVLYTGMIGVAQGLETIVEAAALCSGVLFVVIGGGEHKQKLIEKIRAERIRNFHVLGYQPHDAMPYLLNSADLCVISLADNPLLGIALPKKFFEYAACGKPIICVSPAGELKRLVERWKSGCWVPPGRPDLLAAKIDQLASDRRSVEQMGWNARRMAESLFSLEAAGEALERIMSASWK